jgi:dTDP-4-dehydrorhamnose reductase
MKILVTGASGMLGATLVKVLSKKYSIYATGNSDFVNLAFNYKKFDLLNDSYEELIEWANPDIIIHCGALTNGNYCNQKPLEALNVNGVSVRKLIDATNSSVKIIYISTDAVFSSGLHLAKEKDCVFPENVYGKSKELGEFFLLNSDRDYSIVRTTIVGLNENKNKSGFVEWIINSAKKGEQINLFDDVLFNPISIWELTEELDYLISNNLISSEVIHIAGNQICTKYEFGKLLLDELKLPFQKVERGTIMTYKNRAKRATDQSLDCTYYQNKYKRKLPSLIETVTTIKNYYYE